MIRQYSIDTIPQVLWNSAAAANTSYGPFLTYQWHRTWYDVFGIKESSWILSIDESHIAPFIKHGSTLSFSGGREIADYLDIIGPEDKKIDAWGEIYAYCKQQNLTTVKLHNIPESSQTIQYFSHHRVEDTTPILALPLTWDTYLASLSRHSRHELRRKMKRCKLNYPKLTTVTSTNPYADLRDFFDLMALDEQKSIFLTPSMRDFFLKLPHAFPNELVLQFLYIGNTRAAGILFFIMNNTLYLYNSGFDKEHYPLASFYLKVTSIQYAIAKGISVYNFLQGSEQYKYDLGGKDFLVYAIEESLT